MNIKTIKELFFPPSRKAYSQHPSITAPEPCCAPRSKQLLILDDQQAFLDITATLIETRFNVNVLQLPSIKAARHLLLDVSAGCECAPVDGCLLDVQLTNGNGVDLYRDLAMRWPQLPVVFLTGFAVTGLQEKIDKIGPARVHSKMQLTNPLFIESLLDQMAIPRRSSIHPFPETNTN